MEGKEMKVPVFTPGWKWEDRALTERETRGRDGLTGREGSLQRQFNFGLVYFEVPVSHIWFFLFNSLSQLWSCTSSWAAGEGPACLPTSTLSTGQTTVCLAPFLSHGSHPVTSYFTLRGLTVPSRKCWRKNLGRNFCKYPEQSETITAVCSF